MTNFKHFQKALNHVSNLGRILRWSGSQAGDPGREADECI